MASYLEQFQQANASFLGGYAQPQQQQAGDGYGESSPSQPQATDRPSRWSSEAQKMFLPGIPIFLPYGMDETSQRVALNKIRIDEITRRLLGPIVVDPTETRSPSPEPVYDHNGQRQNTRVQRIKDKLNKERQRLVDESQKLNPSYRPPADFKPMKTKLEKKFYIPTKQYPDYNFIGAIIGPRGNTQKRLERETGAKIVIRGKGAVKEGKVRKDGKPQPGEDDELHVFITADTQESMDKASKTVQELLTPMPEDMNEHKRQQLRELAMINGTLRDDEYEQQRNKRFRSGNEPGGLKIRCQICGDGGHPTVDCPRRGQALTGGKFDEEFESFMAELDGSGGAGGAGGLGGAPGGGPRQEGGDRKRDIGPPPVIPPLPAGFPPGMPGMMPPPYGYPGADMAPPPPPPGWFPPGGAGMPPPMPYGMPPPGMYPPPGYGMPPPGYGMPMYPPYGMPPPEAWGMPPQQQDGQQ